MLIDLLVFCVKFIQNTNRSITCTVVFCINFIQNTNRSISIVYEFHTEYLFESNLYWVYSDIHVPQIAFLDWFTRSPIINEFYEIFFKPLTNNSTWRQILLLCLPLTHHFVLCMFDITKLHKQST